ncbi:hypothetical protein CLAVI_000038 [Candidatus Clavichlamydia salmonicola]|uniref:hypothetical protein n=1 Tax=Candidatus Clavichlamydia salmonicola TaxID=469812 RepID=UPI0018911861|nr:hypothetical protein [Candidatus Clavichlamydia salmonicola]MBF5050436.1 hypothetical protein [Candidatus Clavichlamydia salmonicola]
MKKSFSQQPSFHEKLPNPVLFLLWAVFLTGVFSPIVSFFLAHTFRVPGPQFFGSLSPECIIRGFFWQFFTFPFIASLTISFTFELLVKTTLSFWALYHTAHSLVNYLGSRKYFIFWFGLSFFVGAGTVLCSIFFDNSIPLYGTAPFVCGTFLLTIFLDPDRKIHLLFFKNLHVKWLFLIGLGGFWVILKSRGLSFFIVSSFISMAWTFFIAWIWNIPNPYFTEFHHSYRQHQKKEADPIIKIKKPNKD